MNAQELSALGEPHRTPRAPLWHSRGGGGNGRAQAPGTRQAVPLSPEDDDAFLFPRHLGQSGSRMGLMRTQPYHSTRGPWLLLTVQERMKR